MVTTARPYGFVTSTQFCRTEVSTESRQTGSEEPGTGSPSGNLYQNSPGSEAVTVRARRDGSEEAASSRHKMTEHI